jgi:hypothetical protein
MRVGDLVNVIQTLGCHAPPKFRNRGLGVVLEMKETKPFSWGELKLPMGSDITVALATGKVETFSDRSVKVVNESR